MSELLATKVLLNVQDIVIVLAVFLMLLVVFFFLGRKWEERNQAAAHTKARWFMNKYAEAEREKGDLQARLTIIKQAVLEEI